jgi:hypothetical protein
MFNCRRVVPWLAAILFVAGNSVSEAAISVVAPFAGQFSEGFESFPNYNSGVVDSLDIASGNALFESDPVGSSQLWIYEPSAGATWGLGDYGPATPHNGVKGLGLYDNGIAGVNVTLTFDQLVSRFGFYYATDDNVSGVSTMTVQLFDVSGVQQGANQVLDSLSSNHVWAGWSSDTPIKSARFTTNIAPVLDDVQFDVVPEPSTALLLIGLIAVPGVVRRR